MSRNDASTSLWLLKFVLVLFQIFYLVVIILVHIGANIVSLSGQCISWVTEYLHAQLIQRSVLSIALLMLYLAKWEELRPKKRFWG